MGRFVEIKATQYLYRTNGLKFNWKPITMKLSRMKMYTLVSLEKQLGKIKGEIESLQERRAKHMASVRKIDNRIAVLCGNNRKSLDDGRGFRGGNGKSQEQAIVDIVHKKKDEFTIQDVVDAYINNGGVSKSKNMKGMFNTYIRKLMKDARSGSNPAFIGLRNVRRGVYVYRRGGK